MSDTPGTPHNTMNGTGGTMRLRSVAEEFQIPENTLLWWRHVGRGPRSFKVGGRVMYKRADVEAWIEEQYETTAAGGVR